MAVTFPSLATTKATIAGYFQTLLSGWDLSSKSAFGKVKAALTLTVYSWLSTARQIDRDAVPTSATSTEGLDEWAENGTGISDGDGGYGRKKAIAATGGTAIFGGTNGTVYALGSTLTAADGITKFELLGNVTIGTTPANTGSVNATTTGEGGNLDSGAVLTVDSVPIGGTSSATIDDALTGGAVLESNGDVLVRIQNRIRNPPKGGTANDYKVWAEDDAGVDGITAAIYPRRQGTGSVDVVVYYTAQTGQARRVTGASLTTIQDYIDSVRPVTVESANVVAPYMPDSSGVAVVVRPVPSTDANDFDLDESGGPFTVASSTPTTITFNSDWTDITTQLAASVQPRIQVITTGVVLPQVLTVASYVAVSKTATIVETFTAPTASDPVFSGGNMVTPIAEAILAHVDALGPSRASGYADPDVAWLDVLRIDQIIKVVLDAVDDSGETLAIDLDTDPTIAGSAANLAAADDGVNAPGAIYLSHITVKP